MGVSAFFHPTYILKDVCFMKKYILCLLFIISLLTLVPAPHSLAQLEPEAKNVPIHAEWIQAAKQEVNSQYPGAALVDLLYVGCMSPSPTLINHIFKFWMSKGSQEFGVYVTVSVTRDTHVLVRTSTEKTDSMLPSYGKWRRHALKSIQAKYPEATIMDYRPTGCNWISSNTASQSFNFWLEHNNQTQLIEVTLIYRIQSEVVISVRFEAIR
jgi:hypothetical protein